MGATTAAEKDSPYTLPSSQALQEAGELLIKDSSNKTTPFKSLYTNQQPSNTRILIVFIRHFFCGSCEEYVRALAKYLPPSTLSATNTTLILIGCGEPICIPDYKTRTDCPFEIYCDPSRKIYEQLGMMSTLQRGSKPEYITKGLASSVVESIWNGISRPSQALKGGPAAQNGGEWLFQAGELTWCHRMENTSGHAEVKELKEVLGI